MIQTFEKELTAEYPLTDEQIAQYQRDGYIKLKQVLSPDVVAYYGQVIEQLVAEKSRKYKPLAQRDTYGMAFLQIANLWEESDIVKEFVMAPRLGRIAAELMRVDGVRMYHDQALFKEPSGGFTPWHVDQFYWPLHNENTVTAWIPLQSIPLEMGPLSFCVGSQELMTHRNLAISDESEEKIGRSLKDYERDTSPFDLGDVSFHSGWTFHRAGPNKTDQMRGVITSIMMEDGIRLIEPEREAHKNDWARWMPGAEIGEVVETNLNPVIYRKSGS